MNFLISVTKNYMYLLIGFVVAVASGAFVASRISHDDGRVIGATSAAIGFLLSYGLLLIWKYFVAPVISGYTPRFVIRFELKKNAITLLKFVAVVYGVLVLYHSITMGSLASGFLMTSSDIAVVRTCPTEIKTHASFILRNRAESNALGVVDALTWGTRSSDIWEYVCDVGWEQAAKELTD